MRIHIVVFITTVLLASVAWGQSNPDNGQSNHSMPGMNMPGHDMSHDMSKMQHEDGDEAASAHTMEGHMDMGPHMKMTELRKAKPGDADRAQKVAETARQVAEKYKDYHTALNDDFRIFLPNVPQKIYHFTNYRYAFENARAFNPEHPTSLLYEKHGDDYKLVGVMYTAPKRLTEDELDERIPLSIAQWHEHVNFCAAPVGHKDEYLIPHAQFGLRGSIFTEAACDAAGGTFHPVIFNWMVHVYPLEKDQAAIWSVERQHGDAD